MGLLNRNAGECTSIDIYYLRIDIKMKIVCGSWGGYAK
jgi:hypothetical protein